MAKKKSLLKKFFGKSKSKQSKNANPASNEGNGASAGRAGPKTIANDSASIESAPPAPPQPQATTTSDNEPRSDSATLDTESDHSVSPRTSTKSGAKAVGDSPLRPESMRATLKTVSHEEDATAPGADQAHSPPITCDLEKEGVAVELALTVGEAELEKTTTGQEDENTNQPEPTCQKKEDKIQEEEDGVGVGQENEATCNDEEYVGQEKEVEKVVEAESDKTATGQEGGSTDQPSEPTCQKKEGEVQEEEESAGREKEVDKKKDKKAWAEERISQMYSSSKQLEKPKPKIEVGNEFNAERRKWIEGLSTPKSQPLTPHAPNDMKTFGKLSDKKKAVEQALLDKGIDSSPSKESYPGHTPNREKAAAQRKAVEDMLKRQRDPKAFLEAKEKSVRMVTSSPGTASSQRKVVEEMLQKQLDPKAFIDAKEKASPQLVPSPGRKKLADQKKWVIETLEKQNDPKLFLEQKRRQSHIVNLAQENLGEKKDFEEHKKRLEGNAKEAEDKECAEPVND